MCIWFEERGGLFFLTPHFFVWFLQLNELIYYHLISHKLIISICMKNVLVPPKFIGWTHDAWSDSTKQTHCKVKARCTWVVRWTSINGCFASLVLLRRSFAKEHQQPNLIEDYLRKGATQGYINSQAGEYAYRKQTRSITSWTSVYGIGHISALSVDMNSTSILTNLKMVPILK